MKTAKTLIPSLFLCSVLLAQAGLDPAKLLEQPTDTWPLYHGDY